MGMYVNVFVVQFIHFQVLPSTTAKFFFVLSKTRACNKIPSNLPHEWTLA